MSDRIKSIVFALTLCLVCSLLLTAATTGLKGYHQKNISLDMHKNVLKSVRLIEFDRNYSPDEIETLYNQAIRSVWVEEDGQIVSENQGSGKGIPIYLYVKDDNIQSYIIPIESRGLWGKIFGYLALENDGCTIAGFTVYKHSETPGLGGEIEKQWFQKNFEGKRIVDEGGNFVSVSVAKGTVEDVFSGDKKSHYVDGISGATLTGKFLSAGLKEILLQYEPVSVRFRKDQVRRLTNDEKENR